MPRRFHFLRVQNHVRALRGFAQPIGAVVRRDSLDVERRFRADRFQLFQILSAVEEIVWRIALFVGFVYGVYRYAFDRYAEKKMPRSR